MKVSDLIEKLKNLPQDAEICSLYDLGASNSIDHVWLGRNGNVYVCEEGECFSHEGFWPVAAQPNFQGGWSDELTDWGPENKYKL